MTILSILDKFGTTEKCLAHLSSLKWGNSYRCPNVKVKSIQRVILTWQDVAEIVCMIKCTANTLFHGVKFSIVKAFLICYMMSTKKGMSTYEIAKEVGITQKTAWIFLKVRTIMQVAD